MNTGKPTRRDTMRLAGWAIAAGMIAPRAASALAGLFASPDSARAIGAAYLREHPADPDTLARTVARAFGHRTADWTAPALSARFAALVHDDFVRGEIVTVAGWMLSGTEARVCAAISLTAGGAV